MIHDPTEPLAKLAANLATLIEQRPLADPVMVGIHTGGLWVAESLHHRLRLAEPLASLDISFYRDDFTRVGLNPQVRPSNLNVSLSDRNVILVDDVLYTGRTIRAAMNELFDYGRPACIVLAVLVDRGERELPIAPDAIGMTARLTPGQHIKLTGPPPLALTVLDTK